MQFGTRHPPTWALALHGPWETRALSFMMFREMAPRFLRKAFLDLKANERVFSFK